MSIWIAVTASTWALASAASVPERLEGFAEIAAQADRVEVTGLGIGRRGSFRVGNVEGQYERRSTRRREGFERIGESALRFSVAAPELGGTLSGECGADEAAVRDRMTRSFSITTTTAQQQLSCRFSLNGVPAGALDLAEVPTRALTVREDRRGAVRWGQREYAIRSVHHFARSPLPAGSPLGYVVDDRGTAVAAVDTSGWRCVLFLPRGDVEPRAAALAVTIALALMWEPDAG